MGKVIDALARGPMPERTIFDTRMVVECCETFHLHWRNLRLELSPENWADFLATIERAAQAWQASGSPRSHVHLELARHWIQHPPVNTGELDVELCDNLYKVAPPPFGDGALLEDDDFVHFHIHDLRVEMTVPEFVQFAGILGAARDRLAARGVGLARLLELLDEHNVLYVVLRNWEALPHSVELGEHSDLDLLVHPLHVPVLDELWRATRTFDDPTRVQRRVPVLDDAGLETFLLCDVRVPGDGYMPSAWSHELLARRQRHAMFWVLCAEDYFLSLLYHVVHHKGVMRADYARRLVELAREAGIAYAEETTCDLGAAERLLRSHGIERSEPDDRSVLPHLPFLHPVETVVSSRLLEPTGILSRVHVLDGEGGRVVVKHASGGLAEREAQLLARLGPPFAPRLLDLTQAPGGATVTMEAVEGYPLTDVAAVGLLDEHEAVRLAEGALELLDVLSAAGVRHRDIRPDNVLVRDGRPVLIDFGWAEAPGLEQPAPEGLGGDGFATPEGGHDDAYAMGRTLSLLALLQPRLAPLVVAMTEADPQSRVADPEALRGLLQADASATASARVADALAAYPAQGLLAGYAREGLLLAAERHPHDDALRRAVATSTRGQLPASAPMQPEQAEVGQEGPVRTLGGEPVRSFVVVAFAEEVVADHELLKAYAGFFGERDDVTLVLWAPDRDPDEVVAELLPAVAAAGLADGPGADLLALALPREVEVEVAAGIDAVYSARNVNGNLTGIPVFRPETIADLRSLAVSPVASRAQAPPAPTAATRVSGIAPSSPAGRVAIAPAPTAVGLAADVIDATVGELASFARTFQGTLHRIKQRLGPAAGWSTADPLSTLARLEAVLTGANRELLRLCDGAPVAVVGAGDGDLGLLLASLGADVDLVDGGTARPDGVGRTRRLQQAVAIPARVHEVDLDLRPDLPRDGYGLALCIDVLDRVENPLLLLRTLARSAGHCVVDTRVERLAPDGRTSLHGLPVAVLAPDGARLWLLTDAGVHALLDRAGWDVVEDGLIPAGEDGALRAVALLRSRVA